MKYSIFAIVLVLVIGLFAGASVHAQPTVADLAGDLMCPCGGCTDVLADCECDTAVEMRATIGEMVEVGQTDQQIVDYFVAQYGDGVLFAPEAEVIAASTGEGVSLVVWVVSFVALAGGGVAVYFILQGRSGRGKVARRKRR